MKSVEHMRHITRLQGLVNKHKNLRLELEKFAHDVRNENTPLGLSGDDFSTAMRSLNDVITLIGECEMKIEDDIQKQNLNDILKPAIEKDIEKYNKRKLESK